MTFGQTVRLRRNQKGFGLNDFAERLGVSPTYWRRVEREQEDHRLTISLMIGSGASGPP